MVLAANFLSPRIAGRGARRRRLRRGRDPGPRQVPRAALARVLVHGRLLLRRRRGPRVKNVAFRSLIHERVAGGPPRPRLRGLQRAAQLGRARRARRGRCARRHAGRAGDAVIAGGVSAARRARRARGSPPPGVRARSPRARRITGSVSDVDTLARNHVDLLPHGGLEKKLALGRPLRVKLGIDVTSPDIHVGRAIPLQRMRAFQDAGHIGVLIVGDYTTRIGDPSGRSAERPILSDEEIDANAQHLPRPGAPDPRPGADGGALQRRVAREAELRRRRAADAHATRSRSCSSATTSRSASPPGIRSRSPSSSTR